MLPKSAETNAPATPERAPATTATRARTRSREGMSQTVAAAANLLNEGDLAHAGVATDARDLLLDEIMPDPAQPRRHFDTSDLQALADDIARRGVLQPILVRPPIQPGEAYRLVAGERRWRAARLAGKVRIPARIRALTDDEVQAAQLAENVLRAELTDIEKGRALRRLYELRKSQNPKTTWEDIASEVGLGRSRIHDLFHLAELPESIADLIEAGRLSGSHGIMLQRAQGLLQKEELLTLAEQAARPSERRTGSYGLSVSQVRQHLLARQALGANTDLSVAEERPHPFSAPKGERLRTTRPRQSTSVTFSQSPQLRPEVRWIVEALVSNTLTEEEKSVLADAIEQAKVVEMKA